MHMKQQSCPTLKDFSPSITSQALLPVETRQLSLELLCYFNYSSMWCQHTFLQIPQDRFWEQGGVRRWWMFRRDERTNSFRDFSSPYSLSDLSSKKKKKKTCRRQLLLQLPGAEKTDIHIYPSASAFPCTSRKNKSPMKLGVSVKVILDSWHHRFSFHPNF